MSAERDMLLTFRTLSGEWADQARKEAKALFASFNERSDNVAVQPDHLVLIIKQIRENGAKTLDGIQAALVDESLDAEPDEILQVLDIAEEIVALDKEMADLARATSAILQTGPRKLDE